MKDDPPKAPHVVPLDDPSVPESLVPIPPPEAPNLDTLVYRLRDEVINIGRISHRYGWEVEARAEIEARIRETFRLAASGAPPSQQEILECDPTCTFCRCRRMLAQSEREIRAHAEAASFPQENT